MPLLPFAYLFFTILFLQYRIRAFLKTGWNYCFFLRRRTVALMTAIPAAARASSAIQRPG